jgi:hypothetical protein
MVRAWHSPSCYTHNIVTLLLIPFLLSILLLEMKPAGAVMDVVMKEQSITGSPGGASMQQPSDDLRTRDSYGCAEETHHF